MASEHADKPLHWRARFHLARLIGFLICEPQLRLGRRRHDGDCDWCGDPIGRYASEKLDFPLDDLDPEASNSREKLQAMFGAEYVRVCLECSANGGDETDE